MTHTIANHGLCLLQNNSIWWFNIFFHHFSQKSHPRLGWLVGHHCTHGFIPDWDEHVLLWPKKQHPKFDQLQMHMILMHCNNGPHNVLHGWHVECGSMWVIPAWDDPHHSQSWPRFVAKQFKLMVQYIFSPFLTKKSSQTGMTCGAPLHTWVHPRLGWTCVAMT